MRLHDLKPKPGARTRRKRIGRGRGSGMGKTSGRLFPMNNYRGRQKTWD